MSEARRRFGHAAEATAEQYLRRKGYRILGRNVRLTTGELDLVAESAGRVVFVDVKARRTEAYGGAIHAVDPRKQAKLAHLASQFLAQRRMTDRLCRFDVILCESQDGVPTVLEHIENAFDVPDNKW
ncbi:MAG: YraN family protein [Nitrospira sp.]|nr:MAG: YraN family protein [Nitrospira sp.]